MFASGRRAGERQLPAHHGGLGLGGMPRIRRDAAKHERRRRDVALVCKRDPRRGVDDAVRVDLAQRHLLRQHDVVGGAVTGARPVPQRQAVGGNHDAVGQAGVPPHRRHQLAGRRRDRLQAVTRRHEIGDLGVDRHQGGKQVRRERRTAARRDMFQHQHRVAAQRRSVAHDPPRRAPCHIVERRQRACLPRLHLRLKQVDEVAVARTRPDDQRLLAHNAPAHAARGSAGCR